MTAFKNRNVVLVILYSFITVGIYSLYWLYSTNKETKTVVKEAPEPKTILYILLASLATIIIFTTLGFLVAFWISYVGSIICLGLGIWGIIYIFKYCKSVEKATNNGVSGILSFILFIIFSPAAMGIIQAGLNKVSGQVNNQNTSQDSNKAPSQNKNPNTNSKNETMCKAYIEQYKKNFSRQEIKTALIKNGFTNQEVENYLNKYY